jgi:hypothetical protein
MFNVKARSMATLIHTFLAQAVSPLFPTNHYLNSLYRWHVLGQRDVPDPGRPPYYTLAFFSVIKDVHFNTPLNIIWITLKQWNQLLLERGVTHTSDDTESPPILLSSRLEESNPSEDFSNSYRLSRLFGLSPEQKSFLFKLLQNILPSKERLHRAGKVPLPSCSFCEVQQDTTDHMLDCPQGREITAPLQAFLSSQVDNLTTKDITLLSFKTSEAMELPAVWLISTCLMFIWEQRIAGKVARLQAGKAEVQARAALLRRTKWKHYTLHNSAVLLDEIINLHF